MPQPTLCPEESPRGLMSLSTLRTPATGRAGRLNVAKTQKDRSPASLPEWLPYFLNFSNFILFTPGFTVTDRDRPSAPNPQPKESRPENASPEDFRGSRFGVRLSSFPPSFAGTPSFLSFDKHSFGYRMLVFVHVFRVVRGS